MTISGVITRAEMIGNGAGTAIPLNFVFFGQTTTAELKVIEVVIATNAETVLTNGSDYTVSGGNGSTGTVTAIVAPPSTVKWVVIRETKQLQETDYIENDAFPAETHENALDRLTAINQEQQEKLDKSVHLPSGFTGNFDTVLPPDLTANKSLVINPSGTGFAIGPSSDEIETAQGHAADAESHATNAGDHATNAGGHATDAGQSATDAGDSEAATAQHLLDAGIIMDAVIAAEANALQSVVDAEAAKVATAQYLLDAEAAKDNCEQYAIDASNSKIATENVAAAVAQHLIAVENAEAAVAQHLIAVTNTAAAVETARVAIVAAEAAALQHATDAANSVSYSVPLGNFRRQAPHLPPTDVRYNGAGASILGADYPEMKPLLSTARVGDLGSSTEDSSVLESTPNDTLPSVYSAYNPSDSATYQTITWNGGTFRRYWTGPDARQAGELANMFDDDNASYMQWYKSNGGATVKICIECMVAPTTSYYHSLRTYTPYSNSFEFRYRPSLNGTEVILFADSHSNFLEDQEFLTPSALSTSDLSLISVGSRISYAVTSSGANNIYVHKVEFTASTGTDYSRNEWLALSDTFENTDVKVSTTSISPVTLLNTFQGFTHSSQHQPSRKINNADSDYLSGVAVIFYNLGTSSFDSPSKRCLITLDADTDGKVQFKQQTYGAASGNRILSVRIRINDANIPVSKNLFELNTNGDGYDYAHYQYVDIFDGLTYMVLYQCIPPGHSDHIELKFKRFAAGVEPNDEQSFDFTIVAFEFVPVVRADGFNLEDVPTLPYEREQAHTLLVVKWTGMFFTRTSAGGLPAGVNSTKVWSLLNQKMGSNVQPDGKIHVELPIHKNISFLAAGAGAGGSSGHHTGWSLDGGHSGVEHGTAWEIGYGGNGTKGGIASANSVNHSGDGRGGAGGIAGVWYNASSSSYSFAGRAGGNGGTSRHSCVTTPGMVLNCSVGIGGDGQVPSPSSHISSGGDGENGWIEVIYN